MTHSTSLPGPHNVITATLANGLRVFIYENFSSETIVLGAYLRGGAVCETVEQAGLANLAAAMLRRGTEQRNFDVLNETVEAVGASFGFGSGRHVVSFDAKCLPADLGLTLDCLAESLIQPAFDPAQIEQVRAHILTGIQERKHSPRASATLSFRERLFPAGHLYGRAISGYEGTIASLQRADIRAFYRQHIGPGDGIVVVVGAVHAAAVLADLERTLGAWRQPDLQPTPEIAPIPPLVKQITAGTTMPGKSQSDILLGWLGLPRRHDDFFPALLANSILGQFGMGGRLGHSIRERQGMAYYASSILESNSMAGTWYASAGVNPTNVAPTVQTILDEIKRIVQEPVSADELADVQANLTGSLPLRLETNGGLAGYLLDMVWYDLGLDYLSNYAEKIRGVTTNDILRVAQTYLHPDRYVLAVAGPEYP